MSSPVVQFDNNIRYDDHNDDTTTVMVSQVPEFAENVIKLFFYFSLSKRKKIFTFYSYALLLLLCLSLRSWFAVSDTLARDDV